MTERTARPGDYLITCDLSGFVGWASDSVLTWNGLRVLRRFADVRNPQDFPVRVRETISVPDARPEGADVYVSPVATRPSDL